MINRRFLRDHRMSVPQDLCADLAFINGKVTTVNETDEIVEAVAVKD